LLRVHVAKSTITLIFEQDRGAIHQLSGTRKVLKLIEIILDKIIESSTLVLVKSEYCECF
jgi:hypothetical protein